MSDDFRPQAQPKSLWTLNDDAMAGLKQTTQANQPLMALHYIRRMFEHVEKTYKETTARISSLEKEVKDLTKKLEEKPTTSRSTKTKSEDSESEG